MKKIFLIGENDNIYNKVTLIDILKFYKNKTFIT